MAAHIVDCPKCSKKALVERRNDLYQCLSCDFKRDLAESKDEKQSSVDFVWILFLAFIMILLVQGLPTRGTNSPHQPLAPTVDSIPEVNQLP